MDGRGNVYDGAPLVELEPRGDAAEGPIPMFRSRTIRAAVIFLMWGAASIILGAVPELSIPIGHVLLSFAFLMAGIALLTLTMAAPRCPAAATLETWIMALI